MDLFWPVIGCLVARIRVGIPEAAGEGGLAKLRGGRYSCGMVSNPLEAVRRVQPARIRVYTDQEGNRERRVLSALPFRRDRALAPIRPGVSRLLAMLALAFAAVLVIQDLTTGFLESPAHQVIPAAPLAIIAVAHLVHQAIKHPSLLETLKAIALAAAFLLWAPYQLSPTFPHVAVFNDLAIGLFVVDVVLVIVGKAAHTDCL